MSPSAIAPADLAPIAAPVLLGSLFNWGLFGALSVQVYLYHIAFPSDGRFRKSLVYGIYLLDTAQTFIVTGDVYEIYAKRYGQVDELTAMHNEWLAVPVFSSIVSAAVQIYYGYRIWFLSGSRPLMGLVVLLAILQGVAGIITGVQADIIGSFQGLESKAHTNTIVWLAGSAACDALIAATMAYLLLRKVPKSAESRAIVTRLVQLIVETGTLTAMAAILVLVLYVAFPQRAYYSCIGAILAKLYANSLLVMFNSRMHIGERGRLRTQSRLISRESRAVQLGSRNVAEALNGIHVQEHVYVHADDTVTTVGEQTPTEEREKKPSFA